MRLTSFCSYEQPRGVTEQRRGYADDCSLPRTILVG